MKYNFKSLLVKITALLFFLPSCSNVNENKQLETEAEIFTNYTLTKELGDSIVSVVFDSLNRALTNEISNSGFESALSYCSVNAIDITNYFAAEGISISRKSDKNRNPQNATDVLSDSIIRVFKSMPLNESKHLTLLIQEENQISYFKPIFIMPHCLACHGNPVDDITESVLAKIDKLYPKDKARGYERNELRGVWEITQK